MRHFSIGNSQKRLRSAGYGFLKERKKKKQEKVISTGRIKVRESGAVGERGKGESANQGF